MITAFATPLFQTREPAMTAHPYSSALVAHSSMALSHPTAGSLALSRPQPGYRPAPAAEAAAIDVTMVSISDLVRYFQKRWKTAALIALPLAIITFSVLGFGEKVYEAESRLLLRIQDANVFNFNEMGQRSITELSAPMLVNNARSELKSRRYVGFLWDNLPEAERTAFIQKELSLNGRKSWHRSLREAIGLAAPSKALAPKDIFAGKLDKAARVEPLKESHVLRIQIRHTDPALAAAIANHYAEDYIRYLSEQELNITKSASQFLESKSGQYLKRLQESEQELAAYRKSENLVQDSEVKDVYGEKARLLTAAVADAEVKHTRVRHDLEAIKAVQHANGDLLEIKLIADNSDVSAVRKQLDIKLAERVALQADCGPRHPKMIALNETIATLGGQLNRNIAAVVAMIESEEKSARGQVEDFRQQLDDSRSKVLASNDKTVTQNLLRDRVAMERDLYQKITLRGSQAELTGQFIENGMLRVADIAAPPGKPASPSTALAGIASMLVFGLVFLGFPVGMGLAEDHIKPVLQAGKKEAAREEAPAPEAAVEEMGIVSHSRIGMAAARETEASVIAVLPEVPARNQSSLLISMMRMGAHGAGAALRTIAGSLEKNHGGQSGPGIVLVASSEAKEGRSLLASALAATLCSQGKSVMLMECNPAAPSLHEFMPNVRSDAASASDLESIRYGATNLFALPARGLPSERMSDLIDGYRIWIERAREAGVEWIVLDSAPLLSHFADVAPLAQMATDVVFVHDPAVSSRTQVNAALNLIRPIAGADAMRGLIINRQTG